MAMKKTIKDIIWEWKTETKIKPWEETIAIHQCGDTLFIITKRPGVFIGYHGVLVDKYQDMLKENGYDLKIHFVDICSGNVRVF